MRSLKPQRDRFPGSRRCSEARPIKASDNPLGNRNASAGGLDECIGQMIIATNPTGPNKERSRKLIQNTRLYSILNRFLYQMLEVKDRPNPA